MIGFFILKFQAEIWKYIYCIMHCTKQNVICIYNFFGVIFLYIGFVSGPWHITKEMLKTCTTSVTPWNQISKYRCYSRTAVLKAGLG